MRLPPIFGSIRFWLTLCAAVRLGALFVMPIQKDLFLNRDTSDLLNSRSSQPSEGYFAWLNRRTDANPLTEDEHCYDEMAANVARGRGFVTDSLWVITTPGEPAMYGGCGYPLFVAGIYKVFGVGRELPVFLFQIALQVVALWFVFRTAMALGDSKAAGIAAAFFTFHPVLVWLSVAMLSEALLVPAMAALIWMVVCKAPLTPSNGILLGALLGVMALTRSTTSALVWIAVAWLMFQKAQSWRPALLIVVAFVLVCAPWTIRNYAHWRRFIPFSTKSGVNAWFFNHPGLKVEFGRSAVEGPQPVDIFDPRIQGLPDEAARDARLMEMFNEFVREHPGQFLGLCWMRFWMAILPARITSTSATALASAWYAKGIPLAVGVWAACLAVRFRNQFRVSTKIWFVVLVVGYWQAIQTLAGPGLRYRLPVEPGWAALVGIAAAWAADMLKAPRATGDSRISPGN